jgi:hypothetical protein
VRVASFRAHIRRAAGISRSVVWPHRRFLHHFQHLQRLHHFHRLHRLHHRPHLPDTRGTAGAPTMHFCELSSQCGRRMEHCTVGAKHWILQLPVTSLMQMQAFIHRLMRFHWSHQQLPSSLREISVHLPLEGRVSVPSPPLCMLLPRARCITAWVPCTCGATFPRFRPSRTIARIRQSIRREALLPFCCRMV